MSTSTWEKMGKEKESEQEQPVPKISFQKLTPEMTPKKLKTAVHGQPKTGKTRWAMSSSETHGPTYIIATEPGVAPLARLFPEKEIYVLSVYDPNATGMFEAEAVNLINTMDQAVNMLRKMIIENPKSIGTVVVDSVTDLWKEVQEWGKSQVLKIDPNARVKNQYDWGPMNKKYESILMKLVSMPCHVIFTGQDKETYSGQYQPTGEYEARWQKQTPFKVDIVISMRKQKDKVGKIHYQAEIEDSRHMDESLNPIAGKTFEDFTFNDLIKALTTKEGKQ